MSASPPAITQRSPIRSANAPQATSVTTIPTVGAEASSPASASDNPRSVCRSGIKKAGALTNTVPAVWAATPSASAVQARRIDIRPVGAVEVVISLRL